VLFNATTTTGTASEGKALRAGAGFFWKFGPGNSTEGATGKS